MDGLDKLYGKYEISERRWIWELIQNAKDASVENLPVNIEIVYGTDYVEFKHSGKPFTHRNIMSLIH
jgi:hypothetical protein